MITCIIPSQLDVVSLSEIKAHLRLDHDHENDYIKMLMRVMTNMVEEYTNKSLLTQTWQFLHRGNNSTASDQIIELPRGPVQEIVSLNHIVGGGKRQKVRHFSIRPEGPIMRVMCNSEYRVVEIVYRSGYGDAPHHVPAALRHAIILGIGEMFEKRQNAFHNPDTLIHALIRPYCTARLN